MAQGRQPYDGCRGSARVSRSVVVLLLLTVSLSGCLADDLWREPFEWRAKETFGANPDGAQAFAGAIEDLGRRGNDTGDIVVSAVEDLPNNVVFQNLRDFLNQQSPGRGDQVHENVTAASGQARDAYVTLAGPAAAAYSGIAAPLDGTGGAFTFEVAERATRVRLVIDVLLSQEAPEPGSNQGPVGNVAIKVFNGRGATVIDRVFDTSRHYQDLVIEGTYGGDNEVREHLGGTWRIEVSATGEGAWSIQPEAWEPTYTDYVWWQVWKGERREVVG